jgi:hypothetical protein
VRFAQPLLQQRKSRRVSGRNEVRSHVTDSTAVGGNDRAVRSFTIGL